MLQIYNTLTRQKLPFTPIEPGKVGLYVCGITVYDLSHMGHARTYLSFDVMVRYMRYLGYDVKYVRNITMSMIRSFNVRSLIMNRLKR